MSNLEQTLSIIKPDAVERNLEEKIKTFIEKNNLLDRGEHYVVTGGVPIGVPGTTNFLFVQKA